MLQLVRPVYLSHFGVREFVTLFRLCRKEPVSCHVRGILVENHVGPGRKRKAAMLVVVYKVSLAGAVIQRGLPRVLATLNLVHIVILTQKVHCTGTRYTILHGLFVLLES